MISTEMFRFAEDPVITTVTLVSRYSDVIIFDTFLPTFCLVIKLPRFILGSRLINYVFLRKLLFLR